MSGRKAVRTQQQHMHTRNTPLNFLWREKLFRKLLRYILHLGLNGAKVVGTRKKLEAACKPNMSMNCAEDISTDKG